MSHSEKAYQWPDTAVESWNKLLEELHSLDLIPVQESQGGHRRSPFVFRGMSDATWPLQTSLERLGSPPSNVEQPALRAFSKYAPEGAFSGGGDWDRLAVAQHNGLPTRVLDWTVSPLVAAHFATAEERYRRGEEAVDGVIWCVNADRLRDDLLPKKMAKLLRKDRAFVYNVPLLDKAIPKLKDFDRMRREPEKVDSEAESSEDIMIFLEPPSIDARIRNQFVILSAMNGPDKSHDQYLRVSWEAHPDLLRRIVISKEAKSEIRDMLDQNNISERMLFPGLPGLCDWLRRYYGPV